MSKIGLIAEGGGMKCAYCSGILDAFIDDNITFNYAIGVSAGAANLASYLAGQRGRNFRFYSDWLGDPRYFGFRSFIKTGNLFGLQYIYGYMTNSDGPDPLDLPAVKANPTEFKIVATDAATGRPVYFDKKSLIQDDYRHVMASCALPAVCKPVEISGHLFYDGGVSDAIPIKKALHDGCDKLVVILSKTRNFVKEREKMKLLYSIMCRKYPNIVKALNNRHIMYKKTQDLMFELEKQGKLFIIAPSDPPKVSTFTMDKAVERRLYDLSFSDYAAIKNDLIRFMT